MMQEVVRKARDYATRAHRRIDHRRKYTRQPYEVHLKAVAEMVASVSRGGWRRDGTWVSVPHVETRSAELLFRHKVISCLRDEGLLSDERIELLLSWPHSGFSVHNTVTVEPGDAAGTERLARMQPTARASLGAGRSRDPASEDSDTPSTAERRRLRRAWAQLIRRI